MKKTLEALKWALAVSEIPTREKCNIFLKFISNTYPKAAVTFADKNHWADTYEVQIKTERGKVLDFSIH